MYLGTTSTPCAPASSPCPPRAGAKFLYLREPMATAASAGFVPVLDAPAPKAAPQDAPAPKAVLEAKPEALAPAAPAPAAPAPAALEGKAAVVTVAPVHITAQDAAASNASSIPMAEAVEKAVHVVDALEHAVGMAA